MEREITITVSRCSGCPFYSSAYGDSSPWCRKAEREAPWFAERDGIPEWCPFPYKIKEED